MASAGRFLRASLKAQGHKGKELTKQVNEALQDESSSRRVVLGAAVAELNNRGFVPDAMDVKKSSAVIRFVLPAGKVEPKPATTNEMLETLAGGDPVKLSALRSVLGAK